MSKPVLRILAEFYLGVIHHSQSFFFKKNGPSSIENLQHHSKEQQTKCIGAYVYDP
jgi:hypothetical protein